MHIGYQSINQTGPNFSSKLQKIKYYLSVIYGSGATVTGFATCNPLLTASGIIIFFGGYVSPFADRNQNNLFTSLKSGVDQLKSQVAGRDIDMLKWNRMDGNLVLNYV